MERIVIGHQDVEPLFHHQSTGLKFKVCNPAGALSFYSKHLSDDVAFSRNQVFFKQFARIERSSLLGAFYVSIFFMQKGISHSKMQSWKHPEHFFAGKFCLSFSPESCGFSEYAAHQLNLSYGLHIKLPYWRNFVLQDERLGLHKLFQNILNPSPEPILLSGTINSHITQLLTYCNQTQDLTRDHDELIQDLLSAVLDEIAIRYCIDESRLVLNSQDIQKLQMVKYILEQEMQEPPSLKNLAHRVGLNDFKLKKGFKTITQQTVGQYLLSLRMRKAARLMLESNHPIIDIAGQVGCNNHGHFSVAFKKYFGQSPRSYRA
ncbi:helix-turn-helix transcriptional regulator [Agarivorans sp. QJM3NY_33]|uniref:helix-turn-helix transcriptional regulator n=1 Tax=Agarivorans sp. QJM3NY_33 TaxID=3421432 RepID=UPI003D7DC299